MLDSILAYIGPGTGPTRFGLFTPPQLLFLLAYASSFLAIGYAVFCRWVRRCGAAPPHSAPGGVVCAGAFSLTLPLLLPVLWAVALVPVALGALATLAVAPTRLVGALVAPDWTPPSALAAIGGARG